MLRNTDTRRKTALGGMIYFQCPAMGFCDLLDNQKAQSVALLPGTAVTDHIMGGIAQGKELFLRDADTII